MSLNGRKIAFLVAPEGVEQVELTVVEKDGGHLVLVIGGEGTTVQAFNHLDKGDSFDADVPVSRADVEDYVGLVPPGGVAHPDALRMNPEAVEFAKPFVQTGVRTDLKNAGAHWVGQEVVVDASGPGPLVSSRKPDDLPAFTKAMSGNF